MKNKAKSIVVFLAVILLSACGSQMTSNGSVDVSRSLAQVNINDVEVCGETSVDLFAGQNIDIGSVKYANDETTLYVTYELVDGWKLKETHVHVGCALSDFPLTKTGNPKVGNFAYQMSFNPYASTYTLAIPFEDIACFGECGDDLLIGAHASVVLLNEIGDEIQTETAWGNGPNFPGKNWFTYSEYTTECCEEPPPPEECAETGDFRTQTQGGWGTVAKGGNPGTYRDANFDSAIGTLLLGDNSYYTITLTSSLAVEEFLPQGGTPAELVSSHVDPLSTEAGVLAGQLTAAKLSVAFDLTDPDFGASEINLKDLFYQDGICEGMTVEEIIAEGDLVISGSGLSSFTASEINECLTGINEAFIDGTIVSGKLCPFTP